MTKALPPASSPGVAFPWGLLAQAILDAARQLGYDSVLLDTLDDMEAARALYEDLGFEEIPPYYHNPLPGAHYLKVDLGRNGRI